jgi:hypothetical protein
MPRGKSVKPVLTSDVLESRIKEESDFFVENATIEKVLSAEEKILQEIQNLKSQVDSIKEVVDSITKNGLRFRQF